jgi:predicted HTH transcriptional regulator
MIQKPFDAIAKADIEALIADVINECKTLEYKQELPGTSAGERKEFLADVSSFANASGGDIIYGVKAAVDAGGKKTGAPESVEPITETTPDVAKLRVESIIRDGIGPRLRVQIKEVASWGDDGRGEAG